MFAAPHCDVIFLLRFWGSTYRGGLSWFYHPGAGNNPIFHVSVCITGIIIQFLLIIPGCNCTNMVGPLYLFLYFVFSLQLQTKHRHHNRLIILHGFLPKRRLLFVGSSCSPRWPYLGDVAWRCASRWESYVWRVSCHFVCGNIVGIVISISHH